MNYTQQQIEWIKSFVSETYDNGVAGKASSQRLYEIAIIGVFLAAFIKVTVALVVSSTTIVGTLAPLNILDIPWGWAAVIMGILGLKVYQKQAQDTTDKEKLAITTNNDKEKLAIITNGNSKSNP